MFYILSIHGSIALQKPPGWLVATSPCDAHVQSQNRLSTADQIPVNAAQAIPHLARPQEVAGLQNIP